MAQAARLQARQRLFNLVVTNVPGSAVPALRARAPADRGFYPWCRWPHHQALGIAIMSYDGRLGFGLLADYDALSDLEALADDLRAAIADLTRAAGVGPQPGASRKRAPEKTRV